MKINKDDVRQLELELTGTCNLSCPLCVRTNPNFKPFVKKNMRTADEIIEQLETFKNVTNMCLAGIMSEPTLFKELQKVLLYLESKNIKTEMYTNGNTHNEEFWFNLGSKLKCTKVIFTVCGSTQELHSKYRVGSDLEQIYRNATAFMNSGNKNAHLQVIKFNYNEEDIDNNYQQIKRNFENVFLINSLPYQERFNIESDIKMTEKLSKIYNRLQLSTLNRWDSSKVNCKSLQTKFISIDQFGNEYPCFLYKLYANEKFEYDYTKILDSNYDFCFECEKMCTSILQVNGMERMA